MDKINYQSEYKRWLQAGACSVIDDDNLIKECFSKNLKFGTGGIRAIMGAGPNRLNLFTVRKATEGFANYILGNNGAEDGIVIAFDNRENSEAFAKEAAAVLSSHKVKVYLFESLRPTPELSFAIRHLKAFGGIVITASHNPPEYNGYKTYDKHGCQSVPRDTDKIIKYINSIGDVLSIEVNEKPEYISVIGDETDEAYVEALLTVQERPKLRKSVKVVYTPLHGTGHEPVKTMLKKLGYDFIEVEEQSFPSETFKNVYSPNPENPKSFDLAIAEAKHFKADVVIATDPDCDRLGVVVRHNKKYEYLTGNQTGAILLKYLLSSKKEKGTLPKNGIVFDTIVTGSLGSLVAKSYGMEVESTLTGFKFIGDKIREYSGKKDFVFGYEESYGYLIKDFCRDKDAVQATILLCEAAQYYKDKNMTLIDVLNALYKKFGYIEDVQESQTFSGLNAEDEINKIVDSYRSENISELEGRKVIAKEDYLNGVRYENGNTTKLNLPKSNVMKFFLEDGSWVVVRPSGNEPKIKYYKNLIHSG